MKSINEDVTSYTRHRPPRPCCRQNDHESVLHIHNNVQIEIQG